MKLFTKEQLLQKYKGKFIDVVYHYYEKHDENGEWITMYEVRCVSSKIRENYKFPEDL